MYSEIRYPAPWSGEFHSEVASGDLDLDEIQLIAMSGYNSDYEHYSDQDLEPIRHWLPQPLCSIFAICGSFQLMVQVHGGEIGPIGEHLDSEVGTEDPILPSSMIGENGSF